MRQCNEGKWDFRLLEVDDGAALMLEVDVGAHIDTSLIKADVHPWLVRLLIKVGCNHARASRRVITWVEWTNTCQ